MTGSNSSQNNLEMSCSQCFCSHTLAEATGPLSGLEGELQFLGF